MLIALHGFTESDEIWTDILAPMSGAVPFLCPLLPGHGGKPCPASITIPGLADELAQRFSSQPVDLIGYSMGGRIALQWALRHPASVRRLVLISCNPGLRDADERSLRHQRDERLAQILEEDGIGPFVAWWEANPTLRTAKKLPRANDEILRSRRLNQDPNGLAGALRQLGAGPMPDLWQLLPGLNIPTLLIAGAADARYCDVMREMSALIPNARLHVVADSGHAVHREQPQHLLGLIREFIA